MKSKLLVKSLLLALSLLVLVLPNAAKAEENQPVAFDLKALADSQLRKGETLSAIENYKKAITANPSFKEAYFNLAIAYYQNRNIPETTACLEKLVQLDPNDYEAYYNLACFKLYGRDIETARSHFLKAKSCCSADPEFKPLIENALEFTSKINELDPPVRDAILLSIISKIFIS